MEIWRAGNLPYFVAFPFLKKIGAQTAKQCNFKCRSYVNGSLLHILYVILRLFHSIYFLVVLLKYNSYTTLLTNLNRAVQWSSVYSQSVCIAPRIAPERNRAPVRSHSPFLRSLCSPGQALISFLSLKFAYSECSLEIEYMYSFVIGFSYLMFSRFIYVVVLHVFLWPSIFYCLGISPFVYSCTSWWAFGLFYTFLAIMNNAAMSICIQVLTWTYVHIT